MPVWSYFNLLGFGPSCCIPGLFVRLVVLGPFQKDQEGTALQSIQREGAQICHPSTLASTKQPAGHSRPSQTQPAEVNQTQAFVGSC